MKNEGLSSKKLPLKFKDSRIEEDRENSLTSELLPKNHNDSEFGEEQNQSRHRLHVQEPHYLNIKKGSKTVEIRTGDEEKRKICIGDIIDFYYDSKKPDDSFACQVKDIIEKKSFREVLEAVGYRNALPGIQSLYEAQKVYYDIPGYQQKETLGVLAFCIEPVNCPRKSTVI